MTLSRSVHDNKGHFQGIVAAAMDTAFFVDALKLSVPEPGVEVALINREGDIIAQATGASVVGKNLASGIAYSEHFQSGQRTTKHLNVTKFDSIKKVSILHDFDDAPLTVIVSRQYDSLLDQWRQSLFTHIGGFLLLAGTTLFFSWVASRRQAELIRERQNGADRELVLSTIIETEPECVKQLAVDGTLLQMNRAGLDMIEADMPEQAIGQRVQSLILPEYREAFMQLTARVFSGESGSLTFEIMGLKGGRRWLETHAVPLRNSAGQIAALLAVTQDVTGRKKMEDQVRQLAFYDPLTALPNRRLLLDRLTQAMSAGRRNKKYAALIFLDLDNFKSLNDGHGHAVGDMLLVEVARRLKECVREIDTVARFGGDEFVVVLGELDADETASTTEARGIAEKIRTTLKEPYSLTIRRPGKLDALVSHECSASIGVTLFMGHEIDQETVLKRCDAAMYKAKKSGRNRVCIWDSQV